MSEVQSKKLNGKMIGMMILLAIVIAVVSTLIQSLILGKSNPAVTGGVVGAIVALKAIGSTKKKS